MKLRPELMPPVLDEVLVARLAKLAAGLDGARPRTGKRGQPTSSTWRLVIRQLRLEDALNCSSPVDSSHDSATTAGRWQWGSDRASH